MKPEIRGRAAWLLLLLSSLQITNSEAEHEQDFGQDRASSSLVVSNKSPNQLSTTQQQLQNRHLSQLGKFLAFESVVELSDWPATSGGGREKIFRFFFERRVKSIGKFRDKKAAFWIYYWQTRSFEFLSRNLNKFCELNWIERLKQNQKIGRRQISSLKLTSERKFFSQTFLRVFAFCYLESNLCRCSLGWSVILNYIEQHASWAPLVVILLFLIIELIATIIILIIGFGLLLACK